MEEYQKKKRVPIRKRVLFVVLLTTLSIALATMLISMLSMMRIKDASEKALTHQLKQNFQSLVSQKAENTDVKLEHYEKYLEFLTDYIQEMYTDRASLIARGKYIDAPRATTPKGAFAMQAILATEDMQPRDVNEDILFFSHLEQVWEPIAKENDGLVDTVYVGTKSGFLPSYDKYSYLNFAPEGQNIYYDFKQSEWYQKGMSQDGIFYTAPYIDSQGRGLTITIGKGFNDAKGMRQGVNCADFNLTGLYNDMIAIDFGLGGTSFALASDGRLISPERAEQDTLAVTGLSAAEIQSILQEKQGILEKTDAFYIYAQVKRVGWMLCARVPRSLVLEDVKGMDHAIWAAIFLSMGGLVFITLTVVMVANTLAASITRPMERLGADMEVIGQGNLAHRAAILRNDEVGDMAKQLNVMVDKLKNARSSLKDSQQRAEEMTQLATRDALTGIRNRTAYDREVQEMEWSMDDGLTDFGMAVVDLNFLKRINDVHGHENGNIAIKKLCAIVCTIFAHSPVFRIGGDEFVVILKNRDFEQAEALIASFKAQITALQNDASLAPWERVSAAIGYACYDSTTDTSVVHVFRRADKAMYACKKAMKALRDVEL